MSHILAAVSLQQLDRVPDAPPGHRQCNNGQWVTNAGFSPSFDILSIMSSDANNWDMKYLAHGVV